jgi:hypothetical protein
MGYERVIDHRGLPVFLSGIDGAELVGVVDGLGAIDTTATADYDQHATHFAYLRRPSAGVLNDPRIAEIDTLCEQTRFVADAIETLGSLRKVSGHRWVTLSEDIRQAFYDSVDFLTSRLAAVLASDKLQMTDAEREKAIVILRLEARGIYAQASATFKEFTEQTNLP